MDLIGKHPAFSVLGHMRELARLEVCSVDHGFVSDYAVAPLGMADAWGYIYWAGFEIARKNNK
jgi:hypothetical protein